MSLKSIICFTFMKYFETFSLFSSTTSVAQLAAEWTDKVDANWSTLCDAADDDTIFVSDESGVLVCSGRED